MELDDLDRILDLDFLLADNINEIRSIQAQLCARSQRVYCAGHVRWRKLQKKFLEGDSNKNFLKDLKNLNKLIGLIQKDIDENTLI